MSELCPVCCVIVKDYQGKILLVKRGREPYCGKWSLISGVGYYKKGESIEDGVYDEVFGDIGVRPSVSQKLFSVEEKDDEVIVFEVKVDSCEVKAVQPYVTDTTWVTENELEKIDDLAFVHVDILKKYIMLQKWKK